MAIVTCERSCPDDSPRFYVSCGNGTVTDNRTGLVWLANANCFGEMDWQQAMAAVAGLGDLNCDSMGLEDCDCGLSDLSSPGDWRLPSMTEWLTMVATIEDVDVCKPTITTDAGNGCWSEGCFEASECSFEHVQASRYWSSSPYVPDPAYSWVIDFNVGMADLLAKEGAAYFWPVRYGQ